MPENALWADEGLGIPPCWPRSANDRRIPSLYLRLEWSRRPACYGATRATLSAGQLYHAYIEFILFFLKYEYEYSIFCCPVW